MLAGMSTKGIAKMNRLEVRSFSMSLDGYGAGPDQRSDQGLGRAVKASTSGCSPPAPGRACRGATVARPASTTTYAARGLDGVGAWIMGRNMFGPIARLRTDGTWKGWWGDEPPYHCPVFVLTHHARPPLAMAGGTTFHFVTGGIDAALTLARKAAAGGDIRLGGGVADDPRIPARRDGRCDASRDRASAAWLGRSPVRRYRPAGTRLSLHRARSDREGDACGADAGAQIAMSTHAVVIAGAGPTGLMLAGELALAGVDVAVVERRANQALAGTGAGGLQSRTIEVLDQRGIADRFLAQGQRAQVAGFGSVSLDISDFPTRHPYGLALWQRHFERILAEWVDELAVTIYRASEVRALRRTPPASMSRSPTAASLRAEYLVGCDGGRSVVRKAAGIAFPGWDATTSSLLAEVEMADEPALGIHRSALGVHAFGRLNFEIRDGKVVYADEGPIRLMVTEAQVGPADQQPTLRDLSEALIAACGTDYGVHSPTWISRFTDTTRQAVAYRDRRVLLAGDAAHVHYPMGGQGLNTGVQDAVNLGWKLAQVVKGTSAQSLLDTYHAERHPVAARLLRNTMAQVALVRADDRIQALRDIVSELLVLDGPRQQLAAEMSGLGIRYDLGEGHPLLGRRMPDLDLVTADGPRGSSRCCKTPGLCCLASLSRAPSTSHRGQSAFDRSAPDARIRGNFR